MPKDQDDSDASDATPASTPTTDSADDASTPPALGRERRGSEWLEKNPWARKSIRIGLMFAGAAFLVWALLHPGESILVDVDLPIIGRFALPSYFTMMMLGFMVGIYWTWKEAARLWPDREDAPDAILDLNLMMLVAGVAGARIMHIFADGFFWDYVHLCSNPALVDLKIDVTLVPPVFASRCASLGGVVDAAGICRPAEADCFAIFKVWNGGLAYYGGFLLCLPVAYWWVRKRELGWTKVADLCSPFIALGLFFGRLGCWMSGCCFGLVSKLPWAVTWPPNSPASWEHHEHGLLSSRLLESLPVHPTQLYEAFAALAIFAYLYWGVRRRKQFHGQVFYSFIALYGLMRFFIEMVRADDRGEVLGLLSSSQLLGIPLVALGVWGLVRGRARPTPAAAKP